MGDSAVNSSIDNMVFTLVICLAAMATAEPGYLYGGYGTHSLGASVGIAGYAPAAIPGAYGGYAGAGRYIANSAGVVHIAKREAEAEAEPGYLYGGYGIHNLGASVGIAGYAPAAVPGAYGGYAGAGRYLANSGGVVHIAKREAEADAEAEPGYLYGGYGIHHLGASVGIAGYAPAAVPGVYGGYAGAGRYLANSAGVVHVAKREAEPGYLYGGYGYGLGYAGLGYSGYGLGVYYG